MICQFPKMLAAFSGWSTGGKNPGQALRCSSSVAAEGIWAKPFLMTTKSEPPKTQQASASQAPTGGIVLGVCFSHCSAVWRLKKTSPAPLGLGKTHTRPPLHFMLRTVKKSWAEEVRRNLERTARVPGESSEHVSPVLLRAHLGKGAPSFGPPGPTVAWLVARRVLCYRFCATCQR